MSRALFALALIWLLVGCATTGANAPAPAAAQPQTALDAGTRGANGK
jgi:hypothetical protein